MFRKSISSHFPKHIAIIPDGNRRWAVAHGLKKEEGYDYGLESGLKLFEVCKNLGVQELTFYGFTNDNTKRAAEQTCAFSRACVKAVELMKGENISIMVVGNCASPVFPYELKPYCRAHDEFAPMKINFLVNYDWQWDIHCANKTKGSKSDLLENVASSKVSRIDLVIRWGGRRRLSGMLPLQTVYSDFYVLDELWPDYQEQHLHAALDWYSKQDVTLGG